ncbi:MAG: GNAT family N-acetyltransferase [Anaerolineae bacterium]|nr:GNAT family N-acetyltransferase [Anaerolineae bacterium]
MSSEPLEAQNFTVTPAKEADLQHFAALMVEGFPLKIRGIFGARPQMAKRVIHQVLQVEHPKGAHAFAARAGDKVIGMLLFSPGPLPKITEDRAAMRRIAREYVGLWRLPRLLPGLFLSSYTPREDEVYIETIVVTSAWRGQGVGRRLLQAVEAWAREARFPSLSLHVSMDNPRAQELYRRLGFLERERKRSFFARLFLHHRGFIYMVKPLREAKP